MAAVAVEVTEPMLRRSGSDDERVSDLVTCHTIWT